MNGSTAMTRAPAGAAGASSRPAIAPTTTAPTTAARASRRRPAERRRERAGIGKPIFGTLGDRALDRASELGVAGRRDERSADVGRRGVVAVQLATRSRLEQGRADRIDVGAH